MPRSVTAPRSEVRIIWALFAVLAYFPLFIDLDVLPLRMWDESRLAVSAYEMLKNHQYLVPYFDGAPDMWSTKPPLLIWIQALLFKVLGPGELALRLPSAICAFVTGAMLVHVGIHWLKKPWWGLIAALILYTSQGYVSMHVARSGDYDSMLVMFMTLALLCVYRYEQTRSKHAVVVMFIAITLAILTKSIQGLLILPGCAVYLLITGALLDFLKERRTWFGLVGTVMVVGGYYLGRETLNPGYMEAVWNNDLGGRYGTVMEGHEGEWDYFIRQFLVTNFTNWYLLVPCGIALGLAYKDIAIRRWTMLLTCAGASYLIVISTAGTKCQWYDAPLYPILASLCALPLHLVFEWLRTTRPFNLMVRGDVVPFTALFLAFAMPYASVVHHYYKVKDSPWEFEYYESAHFLQDAMKGRRELKADVFCYDDYNGPLLFYAHVLTDQGHPIRSVSKYDLVPGMRTMASQPEVKEFIEARYEQQVIETDGNVVIFQIAGPKHAQP